MQEVEVVRVGCDALHGRHERIDTSNYQEKIDVINKGTFTLPEVLREEAFDEIREMLMPMTAKPSLPS